MAQQTNLFNIEGERQFPDLTPSQPLQLDENGIMTSGPIDLTAQVAGALPVVNGGTGSGVALTNGKLMVSNGGAIVEGTSSSAPVFAGTVTAGGVTTAGTVAAGTVTAGAGGVTTSGNVTTTGIGEINTAGGMITGGPIVMNGNTLFMGGGGISQCSGISAPPGGLTITGSTTTTGTVTINSLSASQPVKTNGSKQLVSGQINLTADVSGTLPVASGGTNSTTALANGAIMVSAAGQIVEGTSSSTPTFTGVTVSGLTASQPVKTTAGSALTTGLINLTSDVSGVLPMANGGSTGSNTGDVTLAAVGSAPNANGATLTGQALNLQPASSSQPGVVTAGTQQIGGAKEFTGAVTCDAGITVPTGQAVAINGTSTLTMGTGALSSSGNISTSGTISATGAGGINVSGTNGITTSQGLAVTAGMVQLSNPVAIVMGGSGGISAGSGTISTTGVIQTTGTGTMTSAGKITASSGVRQPFYAQMTNSTSIALNNNSNTAMTFNTTNAMVGISYAAGIFTLPVAGLWLVNWTAALTSNPAIEVDMIVICSAASSQQYGNCSFNSNKGYLTLTALVLTTAANQTVAPILFAAGAGISTSNSPNYNCITISLVNAT